MSLSNRESLGYIAEVTWGTNPGGTKQLINFTDNSIGQSNETTASNIIRSDTNRHGTIRTAISPGGSVGIELMYGGYDDFIQGALRNTWAAAVTITAATLSAASSDNSFNDSGNGFVSAGFVAGQWIKVSGFTGNTANNGYFRVTSVAAGKLVVTGGTLVDDSAGESVTIKGTLLKNGTTEKSFTFERSFADITQFDLVTGLRVTEMSLDFNLSSIATGSISFLGKQATASGSSGFSGSTAAATTDSMNTIDNIRGVYVDGVLVTTDLTQISLGISTNGEARRAIGSLPSVGVRTGSIAVTGTMTEYFEDTTLLAKARAYTDFSLAFIVADAAGNAYVFELPTVNINTGNPDNPGLDQDITIPYGLEATYNSTYGATIGVTRIPA